MRASPKKIYLAILMYLLCPLGLVFAADMSVTGADAIWTPDLNSTSDEIISSAPGGAYFVDVIAAGSDDFVTAALSRPASASIDSGENSRKFTNMIIAGADATWSPSMDYTPSDGGNGGDTGGEDENTDICTISLYRRGINETITDITVSEAFDVKVNFNTAGATTTVSFASDDAQSEEGVADGTGWVSDFDWDETETKQTLWTWYSDTKTVNWFFDSAGQKHVWAAINHGGNTFRCHADIEAKALAVKQPCQRDTDCQGGKCGGGFCLGFGGQPCEINTDCLSDLCRNDKCAFPPDIELHSLSYTTMPESFFMVSKPSYANDLAKIKWYVDGAFQKEIDGGNPYFFYVLNESGKQKIKVEVTDVNGAKATVENEVNSYRGSTKGRKLTIDEKEARKIADAIGIKHDDDVDCSCWWKFCANCKDLYHINGESEPIKQDVFLGILNKEILVFNSNLGTLEKVDNLTYGLAIMDTMNELQLIDKVFKADIKGPEGDILATPFDTESPWKEIVEIWAGLAVDGFLECVGQISTVAGITTSGISMSLMVPQVADILIRYHLLKNLEYRAALMAYINYRFSGNSPELAMNAAQLQDQTRLEAILKSKDYFENLFQRYQNEKVNGALSPQLINDTKDNLKTYLSNIIISYSKVSLKDIQAHSPVNLAIYDSEGNMVGSDGSGPQFNVPNSLYDEKGKRIIISSPIGEYRIQVTGTGNGVYGLEDNLYSNGKIQRYFMDQNIPIITGETHNYLIDWGLATENGENGAEVQIDNNGDGEFEETKTLGSIFSISDSDINDYLAVTKLEYAGVDILAAATAAAGDEVAPLTLAELKETPVDIQQLAGGSLGWLEKKKLKIKVKLLETAGNEFQGKDIKINFNFLAKQ